MSNARPWLAFASGQVSGSHVSSRGTPFLLKARGTSRSSSPLAAHRPTGVGR